MAAPIVLIHGFPLDAGMWEAQAQALRAQGHRVLTPELPGFGAAAPWPKEKCSIEAFAELVRDLIVREAGGRAVVGGFSMGGYVLLSLLRDFPEVVQAGMMIDSRPEADTPESRATRLKTIEDVSAKGLDPLADALLAKLLSKRTPADLRERVRAIILRQSTPGIVGAQWAMTRRRDQTDLLPELKLPMLLLVGAEDAITPPSVTMAMQNHMPHAMVVQVSQAGHMAPMENPEAVSDAIVTFLRTF